jgi:ABC-2 type transport system ATP-binding protein
VNVLTEPKLARTRVGLCGQSAAVDELLTGRQNLEMVGRLYQSASPPTSATG